MLKTELCDVGDEWLFNNDGCLSYSSTRRETRDDNDDFELKNWSVSWKKCALLMVRMFD